MELMIPGSAVRHASEARCKIWLVKYIYLSPLIVLAAVRSKAVALLLLIHCLLLLTLFVGVLCLILVLLYNTYGPFFSFIIISLMESWLL